MILTCERCQTRYRLDDAALGGRGVQVRCPSCSNMWLVRHKADSPSALDSLLATRGETVQNLPMIEVLGPAETRPRATLPQPATAPAGGGRAPEFFADAATVPAASPIRDDLPRRTAPGHGAPTALGAPSVPRRMSGLFNALSTVALLALLGAGVLFFIAGARLGRPSLVHLDAANDFRGVRLVAARSVLYPTDRGGTVLVVTGEAENHSATPQTNVDVVVELRDRNELQVRRGQAPLGVALDPLEIAAISDARSLHEVFRRRAVDPAHPIPPGGRAPYDVVILDPPAEIETLSQHVLLDQGRSLALTVPDLSPPPPAASLATASDDDAAKQKPRGKKAKGKNKRKAADAATR